MDGGSETDTQPPDVFVSYSRTDEAAARRIITFLENEGLRVWWDGMLGAGEVYIRTTEQALEQASAVLVLWSARSADSNWVRDEAQSGRETDRLVPVSIDGTQPPLGFRQFQSVDLSDWDGDPQAPQIRNVRDSIARRIERPVQPVEPLDMAPMPLLDAAPSTRQGGRIVWGALAIAVALVVGVLGWAWLVPGEGEEASSIAILPFDNLSEDPDQDYFSTGLAEEMRQVLSQNGALQVAAQTSSIEAAGAGLGAEAMAQALGVHYLLDGSVRRDGETVRVTVQLIDGTTGFDVWSETYERSLDDIFGVQSDIASRIADALQLQMASGEGEGGRIGGTDNPAAYDAFLKGQSLYDLALDEDTDRAAMRQFKLAIEADPDYGAAWASLARVQTLIANSYPTDRPLSEAYGEAIASANKAVEVAPRLARSHAALGFVLLNGRLDAAAAEGPFREAYRLGSGDADILLSYATFAARIGDFDEAREAIERARKLDPLNAVVRRSEALIHYAAGDYGAAVEAARAALEINPEMSVAHRIIGDVAYLEGDYNAALKAYEAEPSGLSRLPGIALVAAKQGKRAKAEEALAELRREYGSNSLYQQAQVAAQSGNSAEALSELEGAFAANDSGLVLMRNDPMFAPIKKNARFTALLQRMGFSAPD